MEPDSILTVPWATVAEVTPVGKLPAAAAAAACSISSFFILAASIFAARFGVGWLDDMPDGLETKEVSREMSFAFVVSTVLLLLTPELLLFVAVVTATVVVAVVPVDMLVVEFSVSAAVDDVAVDAVDDDIDVIAAAIAGMACVLMICIAGGFADGGITGRASCASSELTTPKLGARWLVIRLGTLRPIGDGAGDDAAELAPPLFCNSCFSNTFCESSDFETEPAEDMVENLHPLLVPDAVSAFAGVTDEEAEVELTLASSVALSTGSLLTTFVASKLSRLLNICDAVSRPCTWAGASSVDLERRNEAALCN